jgi:Tryptophan-rich Synechocystis species C-terminal domain/Subtilase family
MMPRFIPDLQSHLDGFFGLPRVEPDYDMNVSLSAASDGISVANTAPVIWLPSAVSSPDAASVNGQVDPNDGIAVPSGPNENGVPDDARPEDTGGMATGTILPTPTMPAHALAALANALANPTTPFVTHNNDAGIAYGGATATLGHADDQMIFVGWNAAATVHSGGGAGVPVVDLAASAPAAMASLSGAHESSGVITEAGVGAGGATAAQVQQALDESGLSVNGAGIKVGVLSDSFNNLGGAAADEADGALPSASNVQVIKDLASGGTDEGRAMMQIIHDIAPGASLAFYTAFDNEQDFANGILALAAAGSKVIVDDVSYFDEPFFQNGVVAQAIQTVEAEGVTYVTAAGNDASNGYQAAWTPISGTFDGHALSDAESFGGSLVQTVTINTEGTGADIPLLLEWNQAYGTATSDLEILVFRNGTLVGTATNRSSGEPTNPWVEYDFTTSGTYQIAIENLSGPNPGLIKEIIEGDGLPATISGANSGTVFGHAMTPGAISAGAVSAAATPAFGFNPAISESFSSSGAGTELLFANNGTALSSPDLLSPVTVSGVDDIATTVTGGLSDFYGTSAASASLAGVAVLILSANPNLTPAQVEQIMEQTAAPMSNSAVSGAGLAQVDPAVAAAIALLVPIVVESFGSTNLVEVGGNYYLKGVSSGTGPELQFGGAPVVAGTLGGWAPIGAEQTSGGYEVALKMAGADEYTVWNTGSGGNYISNAIGAVSGTSAALEGIETTFQQDLNGDGVIGIPTTVIESFGSTKLVEAGSNYYLDSISSGTGPELQFGGAPVVAGTLGGWAPIGTEQTSGGYEVALKMAGVDEYTVWNTGSSGNYISNAIGAVSGASAALEALETSFNQDLNGDGVIGIPAGTGAASSMAATDATPAAFTGSSLTLSASPAFNGQIVGFAGDGTLQGWDQIDLRGVSFNSIHSAYDSSTDVLAVTDGTNTTDIHFLGNYTQDNFKFENDGDGGSIVYAQTGAAQSSLSSAGQIQLAFATRHDNFVFASNFGQATISNFAPATDTIAVSKTVFAKIDALLAATHDDTHGNAVITDAAHDTVTIQNVTTAQLQAHQSDFHIF